MVNLRSTSLGSVAVTLVSLTLAAYFCFSAIQGDYGNAAHNPLGYDKMLGQTIDSIYHASIA